MQQRQCTRQTETEQTSSAATDASHTVSSTVADDMQLHNTTPQKSSADVDATHAVTSAVTDDSSSVTCTRQRRRSG